MYFPQLRKLLRILYQVKFFTILLYYRDPTCNEIYDGKYNPVCIVKFVWIVTKCRNEEALPFIITKVAQIGNNFFFPPPTPNSYLFEEGLSHSTRCKSFPEIWTRANSPSSEAAACSQPGSARLYLLHTTASLPHIDSPTLPAILMSVAAFSTTKQREKPNAF